jgi:hypothetical protein
VKFFPCPFPHWVSARVEVCVLGTRMSGYRLHKVVNSFSCLFEHARVLGRIDPLGHGLSDEGADTGGCLLKCDEVGFAADRLKKRL